MRPHDKIQLFEEKRIRTAWDEEKEEWYFSIVDVVAVLTDQPDQRGASNYWAKLKQRLKEEGADQLLTNCQQLKMKSPKDGKRYLTDVADTEQLLRIIQSIPSPKAEPFKLWPGAAEPPPGLWQILRQFRHPSRRPAGIHCPDWRSGSEWYS